MSAANVERATGNRTASKRNCDSLKLFAHFGQSATSNSLQTADEPIHDDVIPTYEQEGHRQNLPKGVRAKINRTHELIDFLYHPASLSFSISRSIASLLSVTASSLLLITFFLFLSPVGRLIPA